MEKNVTQARSERQEDLLARYCSEAEGLILAAKDAREAQEIRDRLCKRFQEECNSQLIVNATRAYADHIITHIWSSDIQRSDHESAEH